MADEVDRVEVVVEAQASNANKKLDELCNKLMKVSSGLTGINTDKLKEMSVDTKKVVDSFQKVGMEKIFSGTMKNLSDEISKSEKKLDSLLDMENKFKMLGKNLNTEGWLDLQYQLASTLNWLETLYSEQSKLNSADTFSPNLTHFALPNQVFNSFEKLEEALNEISKEPVVEELVSKFSNFDAKVKESFDNITSASQESATKTISPWQQVANKMNTTFSIVSGNAKAIKDKLTGLMSVGSGLIGLRGAPSEEYVELAKSIAQAEKSLESLYTRQEKMEVTGVKKNSSSWKGLQYDIKNAETKLKNYENAMKHLKSAGRDRVPLKLEANVSDGLKKFNSAFMKLLKTGSKTSKKLSGFFKLSNMIKLQAIRMAIRTMLNGLLDGAKEGIQNLAKYSTGVNDSLSTLVSGLASLKNGFAVAFAPILQYITPALEKLTTSLLYACNAVSRFFALLGGKSSYIKATSIVKDYASSLDNATSSAKKLAQTTLGIDELNINSGDSDKGGGSETDVSDMFEEVPLDNISDFSKKLKEAIDALNFYDAGKLLGEKLNQAMANINWDSIQAKAKFIATKIADFLNGGLESIDWKLVGATLAQGLNTGLIFLNTFATTFHWDSLGKAIYGSINGFFLTFDFVLAGETITNIAHGMFTTLTTAIEGVDWGKIGSKIKEFMCAINWGLLMTDVSDTIIDALLAALEVSGSLIFDGTSLEDYFNTGMIQVKSDVNASRGKTNTGNDKVDGAALEKIMAAYDRYNAEYDLAEKMGFITDDDIEKAQKFADALGETGDQYENLNTKDINGAWRDLIGNMSGMSEQAGMTSDNMQEMYDEFTNFDWSFDNIFPNAKNWGTTFQTLWENIKSPFSAWWTELTSYDYSFDNVFPQAKEWGNKFSTAWENIKTSFTTGWQNVCTWWDENIISWWDNSVAIWFTQEQWSLLWDNVVIAFQTMWQGIVDWWTTSAIYVWWNENVVPWFSITTWTTLLQSIPNAFMTKWTETSTKWKINIKNWWDNDVAKWFVLKTWTNMLASVPDSFKQAFKDAANGAIGFLNGVIGGLEDMVNKAIEGLRKLAEAANRIPGVNISFSMENIKLPRIQAFKTGGFPEDGLFYANHSELVGKFSNGKTAVANNGQIVNGISNGVEIANEPVVQAVLQMAREIVSAINEKDTTVNIGDRDIALSANRGQSQLGATVLI